MFKRKYRLRTLMLTLSVGGILLTSALLLSSLTLFQKGNIEESLLESNIAYARKLADTTDRYLVTAQRELEYSASLIHSLDESESLKKEADRLRMQSGFFNSVVIVTADAVVAATSPESLDLIGVKLNSDTSRYAIQNKKKFISQPFISAAGNYVVFLSQPIFTSDGNYLGFMGGTIYLKKHSMLSDILGQHFYGRETNVTVVTNEGRIIFSHEPALIGKLVKPELAFQERLEHARNGHFVDRDRDNTSLIGYASLEQADWNVFISGTTQSVTRILANTVINAVWFTLAIILVAIAIAIYFAARISRPLEQLAEFTRSENSEKTLKKLRKLTTWYQEADDLRESVSHHLNIVAQRVNSLSDEAMTDPLTGLYNRKGFSSQTGHYDFTEQHCIIAIDIDHFKKVNDRYGHDVGDAVLVELSDELRDVCREQDVICRFGGEEFIIFLPNISLEDAAAAAERIRQTIAKTTFTCVDGITLSLGVSALVDNDSDMTAALRQADLALYEAKSKGRDAVVVSGAN